jgi:signal transduction histidine kinase
VGKLGRFFRSYTFTFVGLVFVLQMLSAAAILLVVRHFADVGIRQQSRTFIEALRTDLLAEYHQGGIPQLAHFIEDRLEPPHGAVILLSAPDGKVVAGNLPSWPATVPADGQVHKASLFRTGADLPEPMDVVATKLPGNYRLISGQVLESSLRLTGILEETMIGAALLAIPIALLGALAAARLVSIRVSRIAYTINEVAEGDLSRRVPLYGGGDSFEALSSGINAMLERIEALISELRIVTDGLAHDLRSPLTRLRATLERTIGEVRDPEALGALESVMAESDMLLSMLGTALQISRAEAGIGREQFVPVDVAGMLTDVSEVYGPLAEDAGFSLECLSCDSPVVALASRELLGQALANLVDNALKYGGEGGQIELSARRVAGATEIAVADSGPGIPDEWRSEALRRFGRLDPSRHVAGFGLGLSLVAAVARLHKGTLLIEDNDPGLRVVLRLPVA